MFDPFEEGANFFTMKSKTFESWLGIGDSGFFRLDDSPFSRGGDGAQTASATGNLPTMFRGIVGLVAGLILGFLALFLETSRAAELGAARILYENNFEKCAVGTVPDEFLVLDGAFKVQQEGADKFLELPGAPLDSFGVLFGPTEKENVTVSARIFGTTKGRRYPAFGIGLNGVAGYKLQISPAKKRIELYKGEGLKQSVPFEWIPGKWMHLKLQITKSKDGGWSIKGDVRTPGAAAAQVIMIGFDDKDEPPPGRASLWGMPFAGTPIRFDDLRVATIPGES